MSAADMKKRKRRADMDGLTEEEQLEKAFKESLQCPVAQVAIARAVTKNEAEEKKQRRRQAVAALSTLTHGLDDNVESYCPENHGDCLFECAIMDAAFELDRAAQPPADLPTQIQRLRWRTAVRLSELSPESRRLLCYQTDGFIEWPEAMAIEPLAGGPTEESFLTYIREVVAHAGVVQDAGGLCGLARVLQRDIFVWVHDGSRSKDDGSGSEEQYFLCKYSESATSAPTRGLNPKGMLRGLLCGCSEPRPLLLFNAAKHFWLLRQLTVDAVDGDSVGTSANTSSNSTSTSSAVSGASACASAAPAVKSKTEKKNKKNKKKKKKRKYMRYHSCKTNNKDAGYLQFPLTLADLDKTGLGKLIQRKKVAYCRALGLQGRTGGITAKLRQHVEKAGNEGCERPVTAPDGSSWDEWGFMIQ
jgi:hypothetical protein